MRSITAALLLLVSLVSIPATALGQPDSAIVDWTLLPDYTLPGRARAAFGPHPEQPTPSVEALSSASEPLLLFGNEPTERRPRLAIGDDLKLNAFTVEAWILDHVNRPAGVLIAARDAEGGDPIWTLGYYGRQAMATQRIEGGQTLALTPTTRLKGWEYSWRNIVLTYDGQSAVVYVNGAAIDARETGTLAWPAGDVELELAAYMGEEPFMDLENMLKRVRIEPGAVASEEAASRFEAMKAFATRGALHTGGFHFNVPPYLHIATTDSINIVWETDRVSTARVEYHKPGKEPMSVTLDEPTTIHEITLEGLDAASPYFYEVIATDTATGSEIRSGKLTFKTAPDDPAAPMRFVVMGDSEARPHVNDAIAKLVWDERPDFTVYCGDLTDGGRRNRKFEWNHEYFLGLAQLNSRIPTFPVPGNGEGDLFWYSRYHRLPSPDKDEGWYTFTWGDTQWFMLDSNRSGQFIEGGAQYRWLEAELQKSTATWKFAAHHHPTYTSDEDDYGNTYEGPSALGDLRVRQITELYERYGVDVVFFGHLHTFERTLPIKDGRVEKGGVVYVQAGGAGGNLEDFAPTPSWFSSKTYRGHHYVRCSLWDNRLELRTYGTERNLLDIYVIEK